MSARVFKISVALVAIFFTCYFCLVVIPPLIEHPDIIGAFQAGFVNPYAAGYSTDTICCWVLLAIWVIYEMPKVKYGWVCILLGIVPGVAVGFGLYFILRLNQLKHTEIE